MFRKIAIAAAGCLMPEIISQKQAESLGLKHYYTGIPCRKEHLAARRTTDISCLECNRLRNIKYRSGNGVGRVYRRALVVLTIAAALAIWALFARPAHSAPSCMRKSEARHAFATSHIYWHGPSHCWDAISPRSHHVRFRDANVRRHEIERDDGAPVPLPAADLRKLTQEPETDLITATPWVDRWTDVAQVAPAAPAPKHIAVQKLEPMVAPRDVIAAFLTVLLSIALIEVVFGRRINEYLRRRRRNVQNWTL